MLQLCRSLSGAVMLWGAAIIGALLALLQLCRSLSGAVIGRRCAGAGQRIVAASIVPLPFGSGYPISSFIAWPPG